MNREFFLLILSALLILAGGLFGGGPTGPQLSGLVEFVGCAVLGCALIGLIDGECPAEAYPAIGLLLLVAAIPVLQLIPMPASIWRALPGHSVPDAISQLVGQGDISRPLSLSPDDTRMRALALIVPIAMFLATIQLGNRSRDRLMLLTVAFAFVSAILGLFQVVVGNELYFYDFTHLGYPVGFFANRNHQGDLMLAALPLSIRIVAASQMRDDMRRVFAIGLVIFFTIAAIATQSRTAVAILPAALLGTYVTYTGRIGGRQFWLLSAALAAMACLAVLIVFFTPVGQHVIARFNGINDDLRPHIWKGTAFAIGQYWPTGSGLGSFVPIYNTVEDLDWVKDAWVNHAHDDYLEILLEAGAAGAALLAGYVLLFVMRLVTRTQGTIGQHKWAAVTGLGILLSHSLTDYPLRTFGLLTLFAFFNGLLYPSRQTMKLRRERTRLAAPELVSAPSDPVLAG